MLSQTTVFYFNLLFFADIAFILSAILFFVSYSIYQFDTGYYEKLSPYECGFNAFEDARTTFDVRFYLVAILFLVFDLEVSFFFPWAVLVDGLPYDKCCCMAYFIIILTVGYVYEWVKGALEWHGVC